MLVMEKKISRIQQSKPIVRAPGKNKRKLALRIVIAALVICLFIGLGALIWANSVKDRVLDKVNYVPLDPNATIIDDQGSVVSLAEVVKVETTEYPLPEFNHIHNILLIGIDSRSRGYSETGSGSLADTIVIMTINENDSTIKLTSIARDSYVYVPGHEQPMKINAAMSYGGPELLLSVISSTLRLDIDEYAYVNFYHMEKIINSIGGVYVHVSESERTNVEGGLNELIYDANLRLGDDPYAYMVTTSGSQRLNGRQAVAYARIRKVGNGDFGRTNRQMEIIQSMADQFMGQSASSKLTTAESVASHVTTNITKDQIEWYFFSFLDNLEKPSFEYLQLPIEGCSNQGIYSDVRAGEWSIRPNWNAMIPTVQEFIFGEQFEFDPVEEIPNAP